MRILFFPDRPFSVSFVKSSPVVIDFFIELTDVADHQRFTATGKARLNTLSKEEEKRQDDKTKHDGPFYTIPTSTLDNATVTVISELSISSVSDLSQVVIGDELLV